MQDKSQLKQSVSRGETYKGDFYKLWYGFKIRKIKKGYLVHNPICVFCGALASVIDHKIPHKGNPDLLLDVDNWQSLCEHCHNSTKRATEQNKFNKEAFKMTDPVYRYIAITKFKI